MGGRRKDGEDSPTQRSDLDRMLDRWEKQPRPLALPWPVVEASGRRRTCAPVPVRAVVPVHYSYTDALALDAEVIAWTDRAVLVRTTLERGMAPSEIWVWASAVTRKQPRPAAPDPRPGE